MLISIACLYYTALIKYLQKLVYRGGVLVIFCLKLKKQGKTPLFLVLNFD